MRASPCTFEHKQFGISLFVHGDDFVASGPRVKLEWVRDQLGQIWKLNSKIVGNDDDLPKDLRIFNRLIRWHKDIGISYEPDPRHVQIIIQQMKVGTLMPLSAPGLKAEKGSDQNKSYAIARKQGNGTLGRKKQEDDDDGSNPLLAGAEVTAFRALVARAMFFFVSRSA